MFHKLCSCSCSIKSRTTPGDIMNGAPPQVPVSDGLSYFHRALFNRSFDVFPISGFRASSFSVSFNDIRMDILLYAFA